MEVISAALRASSPLVPGGSRKKDVPCGFLISSSFSRISKLSGVTVCRRAISATTCSGMPRRSAFSSHFLEWPFAAMSSGSERTLVILIGLIGHLRLCGADRRSLLCAFGEVPHLRITFQHGRRRVCGVLVGCRRLPG